MSAPSIRKLALAAAGVTTVAVAGLAVFVLTARPQKPQGGALPIVVTDRECRPNHLTVPAGTVTFSIRNEGTRAQEWEIIQGLMVVEERENIAPGTAQNLTVRLEPGEYEITCGSQSKFQADLRGKLTATPSAQAAQAQPAKPKAAELVGALAEYRFFLLEETAALKDDAQRLADAVKAGDLAQAQALYAPAHAHYERIKPIAELFSDLDAAMDSRADDHERKEADPTFTGFHRLEYALFAQKTTQGQEAVADKLMADIASLGEGIRALSLSPEKMAGGGAVLLGQVAATGISGDGEHYSRSDLWDIKANMEGAEEIVTLLRPMMVKADKPLQDRIDANLAAIDALLAKYALPDGNGAFQTYDKLTQADRDALKAPVAALTEDLSKVRGTLGLN